MTSASKIVFLMIAGTACGAFLFEVVRGTVLLETKDFMVLAGAAFAFYFSYKGAGPGTTSSTTTSTTETAPYAGK